MGLFLPQSMVMIVSNLGPSVDIPARRTRRSEEVKNTLSQTITQKMFEGTDDTVEIKRPTIKCLRRDIQSPTKTIYPTKSVHGRRGNHAKSRKGSEIKKKKNTQ
jgi:hypothetical protein